MKNKGFTLIELLAVIVILAVIALIATPLIMGTISKAKMNSLKDSAYGILKAAEQESAEEMLVVDGDTKPLVIKNLETETTLKYKGKKPKCGYVVIDSDIEKIVLSDGQYVARKNYTDKEMKVSKGTCSEIQTEIASIDKPIQDGLQLYFDGTKAPIVENGNLVWKDQSGTGKDGIMRNFTGKDYYQNNSIVFDGTEYVTVGGMHYENATVETVATLENKTNREIILMGNFEGGGYGITYYKKQFHFQFYIDGDRYIIDYPNYNDYMKQSDAVIGKKYYLAGTYDSKGAHFYQNAEHFQYPVSGKIGKPMLNTIMMLGVNPEGTSTTGTPFIGSVSSVRIYNRALDEEEIKHNSIVDKLKYA